MQRQIRTAAALAALAALAGCQTLKNLPAAHMALPPELSGDAAAKALEELPLQGIGGKGQGNFTVGDAGGRFERSASRLALFDATVSFDRASVRYTLQRGSAPPLQADCSARRTEVQRSVLALPLRPFTVGCDWSSGAKLALDAEPLAAGGTQEARKGRFQSGDVVLELRSVHQLQGTKWPLAQAAGYLFTHRGVPVAALELTDVTPRLLRPRTDEALRDAVTQAALALALLWDPAAP